MKIYVHRTTGVATSGIRTNSPIANLTAKLGYWFVLDVVFHADGVAVELEADSPGVFVVKKTNAFGEPHLFALTEWTKSPSASEGYRFAGRVAGEGLTALLAQRATAVLMCDVSWIENEEPRATQQMSFTLANQIWRDDEPTLPDPDPPYPPPSQLVRRGEVGVASGVAGLGEDGRVPAGQLPTQLRRYAALGGAEIDMQGDAIYYAEIEDDIAFTVANAVDGALVLLRIKSDGAHTVTWPGGIIWAVSPPAVLPAASLIELIHIDGETWGAYLS